MSPRNWPIGCRSARVLGLLVALTGFALPAAQAASDGAPDPLNDTWEISLGMYVVEANTDVTVDGKTGERGTKVDWNREFGGGSQTRFRVDGQWRFAERHKLKAMWFSSSRSETSQIDRDIEWDGETYPLGATVKGSLDYDVYLLDYEYAFMRRESYELSASIGAYYANWKATLDATLDDPQNPGVEIRQRGDASLNAPLPVLGLRGQWVLPYDFNFDLSGQWFYLSVNQYSGHLEDYRATLTWQPRTWLGLGVGYDWFGAHGDVDKSDFRGSLDWSFSGLMVYYKAVF